MGVKPNRPEWLKRNPKVVASGPAKDEGKPVVASDLLKSNHPLHNTFQNWCVERSVEPSRRQAAKFLQAHPSYRTTSPA